jgi:hypothetical protein
MRADVAVIIKITPTPCHHVPDHGPRDQVAGGDPAPGREDDFAREHLGERSSWLPPSSPIASSR